jgi:hypothetical protein
MDSGACLPKFSKGPIILLIFSKLARNWVPIALNYYPLLNFLGRIFWQIAKKIMGSDRFLQKVEILGSDVESPCLVYFGFWIGILSALMSWNTEWEDFKQGPQICYFLFLRDYAKFFKFWSEVPVLSAKCVKF